MLRKFLLFALWITLWPGILRLAMRLSGADSPFRTRVHEG